MTPRVGRTARGIALLALVLSAPVLYGATTRIWVVDSSSDFSLGEARGVAVTADGSLVLAGEWKRVEGLSEASLFAAAVEKDGSIALATGDSGRILRVTPAGKVETVATLIEKEVTAIAVGPDGALYVAAAPGGKVYRVADGKASITYAPAAKYVWALAFSGSTLWVGTGLPGEIHRVTAAGKGERVHATSDAHVRVLHVDRQGRIWAGTSGLGLVLRVETSGRVVTVYDSPRSEVTSIAGGSDGRLWIAASSGDTSGAAAEPISAPPSAPAISGKRTEGVLGEEGKEKAEVSVSVGTARVAPASGSGAGRYASEIVILQDGEAPRTVWTSAEEMVFALQAGADGKDVLAATGPRGRLYRVAADAPSLERTLDEKQVTVLAEGAIGTNAATALYRRQGGPRQGEYVSAVKDTGRTGRFGAFRFEGDVPAGAKVEFAFRSGEAAAPDSTWSAWSAFAAAAAAVDAPAGRYLQWKVRMSSGAAQAVRVRRVEASYRNRNSSPAVENLAALGPSEVYARSSSSGQNVFETTAPDEKGIFTSLEEQKPEGAPRRLLRKGYRTITWKASDPDGDPLSFDLEARPPGSDRWISLRRGLKETFYSFDTTALPDGDYIFRLTASDAETNPEDRKSDSRESSPVRIDNTPPVIRKLSSAAGVFEFEASDAMSPILEAEYSVDAKEWIRVEPADGLSDSPTENYRIRLDPQSRGGFLLLRVTDAARNVVAASFTAP
ncbi:MAG: SMP-30/gluconolactonase/LRE family protein [Thermoanaerobaculia bacterium]